MTYYSVSNPFMQVLNLKGAGLNDGDVYFGISGQDPITHPVQVYWDAAATQPASQPIPTTGGYLYRSGSPAAVYFNGAYSIKVLDKNGAQIYYQPTVLDPVFGFIADLAGSTGAGLVGASQSNTYAQGTLGDHYKRFICVTDAPFNAKADGATDDSAAIQAAIDFASGLGGGAIYFPAGTYKFATTLVPKAEVEWFGAGTDATILKYYGSTLAINAVGTNASRLPFFMQDLQISSSTTANNAVGLRLAYNHRSFPLTRRVKISGFGGNGVEFSDQNQSVTLQDLYVVNCGKTATNAAGVSAGLLTGRELDDIRFVGLRVEDCGNATSNAGGVNIGTVDRARGMWFSECLVEGNTSINGGDEFYVSNVDVLGIEGLYLETNQSSGTTRHGLHINNCNASVDRCRISSFVGNTNGRAIYCTNGTSLSISGTGMDSDFTVADVALETGSFMAGGFDFEYSIDPPRVIKDATSSLLGGGMQAYVTGGFTYSGGTIGTTWGENVASITRTSTGLFRVTLIKRTRNTSYHISAFGENQSLYPYMLANRDLTSSASTDYFDIAFHDNGGTIRDPRTASFTMHANFT